MEMLDCTWQYQIYTRPETYQAGIVYQNKRQYKRIGKNDRLMSMFKATDSVADLSKACRPKSAGRSENIATVC